MKVVALLLLWTAAPEPEVPVSEAADAPQPEPGESAPEPIQDESRVVIVRATRREAVQQELDVEQAERVAGTQGDAVKALRTVPGVSRPQLGSGGLSIWGATPAQSRLYVDGIPVPRLFHLGGSRSIMPTPMVGSVRLVPAGARVPYGRAIGGFAEVETRVLPDPGDPILADGFARLDPIDVAAGAGMQLGERAWTSAALRRSLLDQTFARVAPSSARQLVPIPVYWDYQSKTRIRVSAHDDLTLLVFGSYDRVQRGIPSATPEVAFDELRISGFHRVGLRLKRARRDGSSLLISAWAGLDNDRQRQSFGRVQTVASARVWSGGLRVEESRRVKAWLRVNLGVDLELRRTLSARDGALTLPSREGDRVSFGQAPGDRVANDNWSNTTVGLAGYAALRFGPESRSWEIEPGLRVEPLIQSGSRVVPVRPIEPEVGYSEITMAVDPRLQLGWAISKSVRVYGSAGRYHQSAAASDLSPIFGTPRLAPARAYQVVAGIAVRPVSWFGIDLTGFWARSEQLARRSSEPTPAIANALVADGSGQNYGGQLSVQAQPSERSYLSVGYAVIRAERKDGPQAAWRLFDGDQTHNAQLGGGWSHRSGVELGARAVVSSGNPRTPVLSATYNAGSGGYDPVFGPHNSIRLPTFFELSARIGWRREFVWGELRTWLDVQNATNRRNGAEYFYSQDYASRGLVRGLPVLPSLGVQVKL